MRHLRIVLPLISALAVVGCTQEEAALTPRAATRATFPELGSFKCKSAMADAAPDPGPAHVLVSTAFPNQAIRAVAAFKAGAVTIDSRTDARGQAEFFFAIPSDYPREEVLVQIEVGGETKCDGSFIPRQRRLLSSPGSK